MSGRTVISLVIVGCLSRVPAAQEVPAASRYLDAAAGLSVDRAVALAIAEEPSLQALRLDVEAARAARLQAGRRPNPSVAFEQRTEPRGTDAQTAVMVEWPLDLFRTDGRAAVAEREVIVSELAASEQERLLAAAVRTAFGDTAAAIRDLQVLDELVAATRQQLDLLRSRVEDGASPPIERDLVDVEFRRLEADRLLQEGRFESALVELKRLLGLEAHAPLRLRESIEALVRGAAPASAVVVGDDSAARSRADVREADAWVAVAAAKADRAAREGRFDISLFAGYMRMDAGFPQMAIGADGGLAPVRGVFHYVAAGARVMLPLLDRRQGEVAEAHAERTAATARFEAAGLTARSEIAAARARDDRARRAVNVYASGALQLARQNLDVVSQSYDLGAATLFDVLAERRRLLDVERGYTDALRAAWEAQTALRRALGEVR